jgi:hypothetical protein
MKRFLSLVLTLLAAGCAVGPGSLEDPFEGFEEGDEAELEQGCEMLLDLGAQPLAIGNIQGTTRYVLDTSAGRCVDEEEDLVDTLRRHDHGALVEQLATAIKDPAAADPSPHPDMPGNFDPHSDLVADPSPHPDTNADLDRTDDEEVLVIIVWVVVADDDGDMAAGQKSH